MKISSVLTLWLILFLCMIGLIGCESNDKTARERIKDITNIEVPSDSKILYHHIDNDFVNGRHAQYTVFKFEKEPVNWLKENVFLDGRDSENERYFLDYFGFTTLEIEEIPNEYIPNFENDHLWLRTQNVYLFYYSNKLMLAVFIAGS